MVKCIFENLTRKQAQVLSSWYEKCGEQDADIWFEAKDIKAPVTDVQRPGGYRETLANGDVIVYCK